MRILVVTNMYPSPEAPAAGIFVREHVRALVERGVAVEVFAVPGQRARRHYVLTIPALARRLRQTNFDIVHAQHTYNVIQIALATVFHRRRPPVVLTMHEAEVFLPPGVRDEEADRVRRLVYSKRIKRWAAGFVDHLVTVAPGLAEALSLQMPHTVIAPGVDLELFRPMERLACKDRLGLPRDVPIVFFPASPSRSFQKGYSIFTQAVGSLDISAHVVTGGKIQPRDMPLYMNAADVVVQASRFEASPMVVKEAMACDRPVVSTDVGDVRELFAGVRGCFICTDHPEDMADKIRLAVTFDDSRPEGRGRIVERQLSIQAVAERYMALYQKIADSPRREP